jgi:PadR family transcriptional regulator, regulatory protein PadR
MPRRTCPRHGKDHPCTCAMGNLYRFVEPVLLFLLKKKGHSYGYELASELREYALTDAEIEIAALYRTLRALEQNDCVTSEWDVEGSGPARRRYRLTARGEEHLGEWADVLDHMSRSMTRLVKEVRSVTKADLTTQRKKAWLARGVSKQNGPVASAK